jgi:hypothetical protein
MRKTKKFRGTVVPGCSAVTRTAFIIAPRMGVMLILGNTFQENEFFTIIVIE